MLTIANTVTTYLLLPSANACEAEQSQGEHQRSASLKEAITRQAIQAAHNYRESEAISNLMKDALQQQNIGNKKSHDKEEL